MVEFDEVSENFSFLYANEAYIKMMHSIGIDSIEETVQNSNMDQDQKKVMMDAVKKAEASRMESISFNCSLRGHDFSSRIRFIARQDKRVAFGLVSREKL